MNKKIFILLIFISVITIAYSEQLYKKVVHTTDPQAACLDGSPPFLYYHEGTQKNKYLIYFFGGGYCTGMSLDQTTNDCYARSKTQLGSSNGWPESFLGQGYLSTDPTINDMANWTKILLGYCDGGMHQGNRKTPISYKGSKLYFKGAVNTRSHIQWILQKYPNFKTASQVLVTGSSTGGTASYLWTNYIRDQVNNASVVLNIPDSSIFLISRTYQTYIDFLQTTVINVFKLTNIDEKTPLDLCNQKYKTQQYKCLFIQYAWTSFLSRTMLINSQYDAWVIDNLLQIKCLTNGKTQYTLSKCNQEQINYIEDYRKNKFKNFMELFLMKTTTAAWTIGCAQHSYANDKYYFDSEFQKVPGQIGLTLKQAIRLFVFQSQRVHSVQQQPWPSNSGCSF